MNLSIFASLTGEKYIMEENDELGMSLFDSQDLELNLDMTPEDLGLEESEEEVPENTEENTGDQHEGEETPEGDEPEENNSEGDENPSEEVAGDEDEDGGGDENSPNLYSSLATVLHEQGLLPSLDLQSNKIGSVDDIANAFKAEIEGNVKSKMVEALGEDGYNAVMNGIPITELAKTREAQATLDSITPEALQSDLELSKRVIYQDYLNQGISEDRAQRLLKRVIDSGEDAILEDAAESLTSLKVYEQRQLENKQLEYQKQQEAEQARQAQLETELKNKIYNSKELIQGAKLNKAMQDKVFKSMTEIVGKNENGVLENKLMRERRENPVEFDAKLYYIYELTNGFKDLSKVLNTTRSSAVDELERSLRQTKHQDSGTPNYLQDGESYFGPNDEIVF
jgi:hypothetical protein